MSEVETSNMSTTGISRRSALALISTTPLSVRAGTYRGGKAWRIAQSTALSGPYGDLGKPMHEGAKAAFAEINAKGGVHGRPIDLVVLDDGYEVKRALANVDDFLADPATFALFNCMGTAAVAAMLPKVIDSGIPFFAPFTGAGTARPKSARNVFNVRASYAEEAQKLVQHLATIGISRIGIAFQNNPFGKEVLESAQAAIQRLKLGVTPTFPVENNGSNVEGAAAAAAGKNVDALIVGLAGMPAISFIRALRAKNRSVPIYTVSVLGGAGTIKELGADGLGITISQVVPSPQSPTLPIVREFLAAWTSAAPAVEPSHLALEGYINARVFSALLNRAGPSVSPRSFIDSTWSVGRFGVAGYDINFAEPGTAASTFVELTMVSNRGRLVR